MSDGEETRVQNQVLNPAHQMKQLEVEGHVQLIEGKSQMLDEVSLYTYFGKGKLLTSVKSPLQ